jgi:hypothetical protein
LVLFFLVEMRDGIEVDEKNVFLGEGFLTDIAFMGSIWVQVFFHGVVGLLALAMLESFVMRRQVDLFGEGHLAAMALVFSKMIPIAGLGQSLGVHLIVAVDNVARLGILVGRGFFVGRLERPFGGVDLPKMHLQGVDGSEVLVAALFPAQVAWTPGGLFQFQVAGGVLVAVQLVDIAKGHGTLLTPVGVARVAIRGEDLVRVRGRRGNVSRSVGVLLVTGGPDVAGFHQHHQPFQCFRVDVVLADQVAFQGVLAFSWLLAQRAYEHLSTPGWVAQRIQFFRWII